MKTIFHIQHPKKSSQQFFWVWAFLLIVLNTVSVAQVSHSLSFSQSDAEFTTVLGDDGVQYERISFANAQQAADVGKPELPVQYLRLIVPPDQDIGEVTINSIQKDAVSGVHMIYPAQPPIPL